ncbi:hypothetical protein DFH08DRAFT_805496 [Mycena albidolilacea]|uniref:Uncharacterized protein n=1 Tax=Mycena albidolilacea TaxID=1033008 RepID=A0AAD7A8L7_9AGAR|nr:hypothetical protein DFH08DRAFT_805496 [Mycena albidolilacea]
MEGNGQVLLSGVPKVGQAVRRGRRRGLRPSSVRWYFNARPQAEEIRNGGDTWNPQMSGDGKVDGKNGRKRRRPTFPDPDAESEKQGYWRHLVNGHCSRIHQVNEPPCLPFSRSTRARSRTTPPLGRLSESSLIFGAPSGPPTLVLLWDKVVEWRRGGVVAQHIGIPTIGQLDIFSLPPSYHLLRRASRTNRETKNIYSQKHGIGFSRSLRLARESSAFRTSWAAPATRQYLFISRSPPGYAATLGSITWGPEVLACAMMCEGVERPLFRVDVRVVDKWAMDATPTTLELAVRHSER